MSVAFCQALNFVHGFKYVTMTLRTDRCNANVAQDKEVVQILILGDKEIR